MENIQKAALIAHTLIALLIIVLVLLQRGKGADAGAAFGAGASGTVFGARGSSSFFSRATAICATLFFVSSLTLAYMSSQQTSAPSSVIEDAGVAPPEQNTTDAAEDLLPELPDTAEEGSAEAPDDMPSLELAPTDSATAEDAEQQ